MDKAAQPPAASLEKIPYPDDDQTIDLTGKVIGEYLLLRRLGKGGMGQVYLAEQVSLKRKVALKILRKDLAANAKALQRFQVEAKAVARATHANIVQVYAIGEDKGIHFMALEYVEGRNLRDFLEKKGPPDVLVAITLIRQVAAALQRASELGIIHRDIKPENILVTRKGEVKVADFGLSRVFSDEDIPVNLTQSGVAMGTPLYMSPEQVEGKPVDPRTDIYSLGVTAYHLLTGGPPFRGQTPFEVAVQHVQKDPTSLKDLRPDLPDELCAIVHKMMAKRPEDRYQTCQEIVRDLIRLRDVLVGVAIVPIGTGLGTSSLTAVPKSGVSFQPLPQLSKRRRFPVLFVASILAMALLGLAAGWGVFYAPGEPNGPTEEELLKNASPSKTALELDQEREQELKKLFAKYPHPKHEDDVNRGMYAAIDLALFYLERQRHADAEQFFKTLEKQPRAVDKQDRVPQYSFLGILGQAILLAFRDEHEKSNKLFDDLLVKKTLIKVGPQIMKQKVMTNPDMRKQLALAMERNYANGPNDFPAELSRFRVPPPPAVRLVPKKPEGIR
jgi:tRNA A-37 threonylcarbamoyl transferase component Bud32